MLRHLLPLALLAIATSAPAAAPDDSGGSVELRFGVGAPPTWVEVLEVPADRPNPPDAPATHTLLQDTQIRFAAGKTQRFYHFAQRVVSPAGIDDAATMRAYFEPSYERLTLHWVRVHRGGAVRDALDRRLVRLAHVEDDLYARIYHGEASAIYFVPDVRVGDVVEVAFTTTGDNPVFGGRVFGGFTLAETYPIERLRMRLLVPGERRLRVRSHGIRTEMVTRTAGGQTEYVHDARAVAAAVVDSQAPAWHPQVPYVEYADFDGWGDVVAWAEPLYRVQPAARAALADLIDELGRAHADRAGRLRAAARFVQDEIRYLGIEVGPSSHRPHAPDEVLAQRFGDCKDKALLLVSLLRGLDIEADAALVNSYRGPGLPDALPDPSAFNHVIVRARLDGAEHWIDATDSMARGRDFRPPRFHWALPIHPDADGLREIPLPRLDQPQRDVEEEWEVPEEESGAAALRVTTRLRGTDADDMRARLTRETAEEIARGYLNFYASDYPGIESAGPLSIEDDPDGNEILLGETYRVPGFWVERARWLIPREVVGELRKPGQTIRKAPLWVGDPSWVRQTLTLRLPPGFELEEDQQDVRTAQFRYSYTARKVDRGIRLTYDIETSGEPVPAGEVAGYSRAVDQVQDKAGYELTLGDGIWNWGSNSLLTRNFFLVFTGGVIAAVCLVIWLTTRRWGN